MLFSFNSHAYLANSAQLPYFNYVIMVLHRISQIRVGIKGEKHHPNNQMGNTK